MKEKSQVEDIDRSIYDFKDDEKDAYRIKAGLTPEIVQKLSKEKHDPAWMELFRLHSLQIYNEMAVPDWGAIYRRLEYGSDCYLCQTEYEDESQMVRCAGRY